VRSYLYGVGIAVEAVLVARGIITGNDAPLYVGLLTAVLGVPAVEVTRAKVIPANGSTGAVPDYAAQHEL
jgi:tetrahydromethanopterin S-methyltransferase subunit D